MEHKEIVSKFIETMRTMIELMKHETDLVRARDFKTLPAIQSKKSALSSAYEQQQEVLKANPSLLESLSFEEKDMFTGIYKKFRETLSENMLAIRATHDTAEKVVEKIVDIVKKERGTENPPTTKKRTGYGVYATSGVATLSCNQEI